jgi:CBS domain-containing protein
MIQTVRDVMLPDPLTIDAKTSIGAAAALMRTQNVEDILVTENGQLCGLLTDSDIVVFAIAAGRHPDTVYAGECCNPELTALEPGDSTERAAALMRDYDVDRLPVVDRGRVVGMVSIADVNGS